MYIISTFVDRIFLFIEILLIARIIMSWVQIPTNRYTVPIMGFIYDVTEPILGMIRNLLPPISVGGMGFDLSPMIAFLLLGLVRSLIQMLFGI